MNSLFTAASHAMLASMNDRSRSVLHWITTVSAILAVVLVFAIVIAQVYIRWSVNRDFTFLGTNELAALTIAGFGTLAFLTSRYPRA
jgi:hypothetical protein